MKLIEDHNAEVKDPDNISEYVSNIFGDSKKDEALINNTISTYLKSNLWVAIDPNEIGTKLEGIMNEVQSFKERFHFILTQSNATTKIRVELED